MKKRVLIIILLLITIIFTGYVTYYYMNLPIVLRGISYADGINEDRTKTVTVNVEGSYLPNRVTGVLTSKQMKINNENKYYAPNPYRIPVGGSYDSNNDGILLLTFNPDEVSIDDIITEITVYNVSEKFE